MAAPAACGGVAADRSAGSAALPDGVVEAAEAAGTVDTEGNAADAPERRAGSEAEDARNQAAAVTRRIVGAWISADRYDVTNSRFHTETRSEMVELLCRLNEVALIEEFIDTIAGRHLHALHGSRVELHEHIGSALARAAQWTPAP
jgi:hypothetical protein